MTVPSQRGFTLPEVLAAVVMISLMIGLIGLFAGNRLDAAKTYAQRAESQYIASLVDRAYRLGSLADGASTATDLQQALPNIDVPDSLSGGQAYSFTIDNGDPRMLVDTETDTQDGETIIRQEVTRAPFPASELRIPLWRARKLRQLQEESE